MFFCREEIQKLPSRPTSRAREFVSAEDGEQLQSSATNQIALFSFIREVHKWYSICCYSVLLRSPNDNFRACTRRLRLFCLLSGSEMVSLIRSHYKNFQTYANACIPLSLDLRILSSSYGLGSRIAQPLQSMFGRSWYASCRAFCNHGECIHMICNYRALQSYKARSFLCRNRTETTSNTCDQNTLGQYVGLRSTFQTSYQSDQEAYSA